jgi:hypothetical protein
MKVLMHWDISYLGVVVVVVVVVLMNHGLTVGQGLFLVEIKGSICSFRAEVRVRYDCTEWSYRALSLGWV